jgi:hypothetical protein
MLARMKDGITERSLLIATLHAIGALGKMLTGSPMVLEMELGPEHLSFPLGIGIKFRKASRRQSGQKPRSTRLGKQRLSSKK